MTNSLRSPFRFLLLGSISALLVIGAVSGSPVQATVASCSGTGATFAGGSGTSASPYQVATQAQLASIAGNYLSCAFIQTADITLAGSWAPIGGIQGSGDPYLTNAPFTGTYDGDSHAISGLSINVAGGNFNDAGIGLFASLSDATVENLELTTASVRAEMRENVGILVGVARGSTITGVRTSGAVWGIQMVGGVAGLISRGTRLSQSTSSAVVETYFGGGGGLVGNASRDGDSYPVAHVLSSSASGSVTGTHDDNGKGAGGLVGTSYGGLLIEDSWATGHVTELGSSITGGLIGLMYGSDVSLVRSFATGNVSVVGAGPAGGLVGGLYNGATIVNSFSTGTVTGQAKVGGLVGYIGGSSAGTVGTSYSLSSVNTSPTGTPGGGILGLGDPALTAIPTSITDSYWNPTSAGASATNEFGTRKTLAQMNLTSTYAAGGWDISEATAGSSLWVMNPASGCLPYLRAIPESRVGTPDTSGAVACAVPAPAPAPAATTEPTSAPTVAPIVIPVAAPAAEPVELPAGTGGALINGVATPVTVAAAPGGNAVVVSAGGVTVEVGGTGPNGAPLPLAPDGSLIVAESGGVNLGGSGFSPNSTVSLFLYSTPTKLGELPVSASGSYSGSALIPAGIEAGSHTIQAVGYTPSGATLALSVGVTVKSAAAIRGAKPVVRAAAGTKALGAKFVASATGIQSRCTVRFWTKGSTATVKAGVAGKAQATLRAPKTPGTWVVTATVSGLGCDPRVTKSTYKVGRS